MITETDLRVLRERRKDYERAARRYSAAREARAANRRANRNAFVRLVALFL